MYECALASLLLLSITAAVLPPSRIVNTDQGAVKGYKDEEYGLYMYMGIPYATVPTGVHKFKGPLPPPTWLNTFEAVDSGIVCPQANFVNFAKNKRITMRENCLIVNIYVPDTKEKSLPVVVSFHGGGFSVGYGNIVVPKQFIKESNIIYLNFNYRLGAHGFLCLGTEDVPGNAGLKDQLALLRWVKKNIHDFGGNPDDVTIRGFSAGSASVDLLMLSKSAEGLFNKVIPESGASIAVFTIQSDPLANAKTYAKFLNFTQVDDISALEDFYKTVSFDLLHLDPLFPRRDMGLIFSPCVERPGEDAIIDKSPVDILKSGGYKKLPLLYGFSNMDGLLQIGSFDQWKKKINDNFADFMPADLKFDSKEEKEKVAKKVKEFYFGNKPVSETNIVSYIDFFTDVMFAYPHMRALKYHLEAGHDQIYLYYYTFVDENTKNIPHTNIKGAGHGAQSTALMGGIPWEPEVNKSSEFKTSASVVRNLWKNFVKTGVPVPEGSPLPAWPPVSSAWGSHVEIDTELHLKGSLLEERMLLWDGIYSKHYRDPVPAPAPSLLGNAI